MKTLIYFFLLLCYFPLATLAENGYDLWLRYPLVEKDSLRDRYREVLQEVVVLGESPTIHAISRELETGLSGLLGHAYTIGTQAGTVRGLTVCTQSHPEELRKFALQQKVEQLGKEGYLIYNIPVEKRIVVAAQTDVGALYGTFHFLRLIQTHQTLDGLKIEEQPAMTHRLLNHWDNLDRTVERGYAGFSIWDWHKLPDYIDQRYIDYARANASVGVNGAVVSNVNANALILTRPYLEKLRGLADVFRPYGVRVYLTARFSAPVETGGLGTADPLHPDVIQWWEEKAKEIYALIPDFGGFLVKANSEGQPGPQNYKRNHAEGANMLARAVAPFGGVVMWRAFVYDHQVPDDRAKQAYNEFKPLDGQFLDNVFVQVKNGAIDFQPREPFHPMFGAMPQTPLMMEFQITQEYTGCATHLVYLAPLFKECLDADTHTKGEGSTVARVIDGSLDGHAVSGMAGVSNIGTDINWTGHPFAQANWYAYGRLAWNPALSSEEIAEEWIRQTFTNDETFRAIVKPMMLQSRETMVNYMTPLGLHHIMARNHHWGPGPWVTGGRPDWTSLYYHRADSAGIGFNRSSSGSKAVDQYAAPVRDRFNNIETCPEEFLLWFHHVPWDFRLKNGNTLWDELCHRYYSGAEKARLMGEQWKEIRGLIDEERFIQVSQLLNIQATEAVWWRNACLLYFQQFSQRPIPPKYEKPDQTLRYYYELNFHYVPGIENR
ncbi:MAG TPA: alpha-glucuronidase family glycosyl hydrolase [Prolixibacteraceae bacterium]|nr:alpha-glucuronidase family glycosyl hydrolase [Prolixibacteraceae bacterium]